MKGNQFGEFVKELRLRNKIGLREFCREYGHDAGNWSKLERGILYPPEDEQLLNTYAEQLNLRKGSKDWIQFMDLASLTRGKVPKDLLTDEELVDKLPLFFRTVRGKKPTKEELKKLADLLRK